MSEEGDIQELVEELGQVCRHHDLSTVVTALTYICADVCIQTRLGEDMFLAEFTKHLLEAIKTLKEIDDGNHSHH